MLVSDMCDYSDTLNVAKGAINVEGDNNPKKVNKKLIFKNNALFRWCI